ncbi:YiiX/YebB-like N1pC/P60 family cysteine hydrolase [Pleomorphovibrio marinus]|uniref:YiiX/YebB-like N1pC/P60 family cysteine hydrolase n=1 Tax=Pleomorphovibrio marinus TaxID=2164132 RepID=UPI000E0A7651|nr:YiiX/YebB-like N1pC/P60 family cysteine hydrolase [Pleomorphovibrio marinus]
MKISCSAIVCYWVLVACFSCRPVSSGFDWKEGDILFQDGDCGDFCEAIRKVTDGYQGRDFSHNGLLVKKEGKWMVLEAVSEGVKLTPLETFLERDLNEEGKSNVVVGRLKHKYRSLIPDAIQVGKSLIGKPYDHKFDFFNDAYYCTELIHVAFMKANLGHPVFEVSPMTFKDPATGNTFSVWEAYFEDLGIPIPEGEPGLNPGGMSLDPALEIVYDFTKTE